MLVDYNAHHKHSYYLVLKAGLPWHSHRELALVAGQLEEGGCVAAGDA